MIKTDRNIRSTHKAYKKSGGKILLPDFLNICHGFNKFLSQKILEGETVTLPSKLGVMSIVGIKRNLTINEDGSVNLCTDPIRTKILWDKNPKAKEEGKKVYFLNSHTSGVSYRLVWYKKGVLARHKYLYSFRFTRANKRKIAVNIFSGKEYFLQKTEVCRKTIST
jgi:hypothetical protein